MQLQKITPPLDLRDNDHAEDSHSINESRVSQRSRRKRVEYTDQEVANLRDGVAKYGKNWTLILHAYHFHPNRTAVDLKDKFRQMAKVSHICCAINVAKRCNEQQWLPSMCV
jgi:Myb-like DNA-binding domain